MRLLFPAAVTAALAAGLLTAAPAVAVAAPLGWHDVSPAGAPEAVGVSCADAQSCLAIAPGSSLTWNGHRWSRPDRDIPGGGLVAVSCPAAGACTAVGQTGLTSTDALQWNGARWTADQTPRLPHSGQPEVMAVSCSSARRCTAVGSYTPGSRHAPQQLLAERWNGRTWRIQPVPRPARQALPYLAGVSCPTARWCLAVGFTDTSAFAETWNGTSWHVRVLARPRRALISSLTAVSCSSPRACTAVGGYSTSSGAIPLIERWNGTSWRQQAAPAPRGSTDPFLQAVSCPSPAACTVVGSSNDSNGLLGGTWSGSRWDLQAIRTPARTKDAYLPGLSCPAPRDCLAVGGFTRSGPNWRMLAEHYS
jgi:hypothetical protein